MRQTDKPKRELLYRPRGAVRCPLDREADVWREVKMVASGMTYAEVAKVINDENPNYKITKDSIRHDVEQALVEWKRENMDNIDGYIALELKRLEDLYATTLKEMEKSKTSLRPNEYAVLMKRGLTMEEIDAWYETHEMPVDPRLLDALLAIQRQRMRFLGLDKGNDVAQNTIVNYNFDGMSDERLASIAESLQDSFFASNRGVMVDEQ